VALAIAALIVTALPGLRAQAQAQAQAAGGPDDMRGAAEQIFALANQARAKTGVGQLQWDPALAAAALKHCRRMAAEGPIAHRYGGEAELSDRAAQAGAHFSVIEENVAFGPSAAGIHQQWMDSPGHRQNLLSPDVDRVGIAVIASRGELYAVADYSRAVAKLSPSDVEARVAALVRRSGVSIQSDPSVARAACTTDNGMPRATDGMQPRFIMRWQDADLSQLPQPLADKLATKQYRSAAVGSCPAQVSEGAFTAYRLAVILY
jgi:uncharacterized protein YkwD